MLIIEQMALHILVNSFMNKQRKSFYNQVLTRHYSFDIIVLVKKIINKGIYKWNRRINTVYIRTKSKKS